MSTDTADLLRRAYLRVRELQGRLDQQRPAIAVIGQSLRLPGGVRDPEGLWRLLAEGRDAIGPIPPDRWDAAALLDPDPEAPGRVYVASGGFIDEVYGFDPRFFGISPREALSMDPLQRLALELAWECLEDGGLRPDGLEDSRTGVFLGVGPPEYRDAIQGALDGISAHTGTGNAISVIAGRVSYTLGLRGPALVLDTACSSALVAVHLAMRSLAVGDCDLALAGGLSLILAPGTMISMCKLRMLARDGRCKTFDAAADGFARGEGGGVFLLKRLPDALRDQDRILAVLRGGAVNQDGRSAGLTAPSRAAQEEVLRAALADARLAPGDIGFVETHGTGTPLGDPIEVGALGAVYGARRGAPLWLGAVKTQLGHLEAASGVPALAKAMLVVQRGQIPPNLHLRQPNPHVPWAELPVALPERVEPWEAPVRRAGVSAFGFSGTNAHLIVESPPPLDLPPRSPPAACVLPLSAAGLGPLRALVAAHAALEVDPLDRCATAALGRAALPWRVAVVGASDAALRAQLRALLDDPGWVPAAVEAPPRVGLLFSGQGAQRAGMGRALYAAEPAFAAVMDRLELALPGQILPLLDADEDALRDTARAQPALYAFEVAMAALLRAYGVVPAVCLGHSVGQLAAAAVAGVFSLEDGARLALERGRLMGALPRGGGMLAVSAGLEGGRLGGVELPPALELAALNSPEQTVVCGPRPALDAFAATLRAAGVRSVALEVSHAFHSRDMIPAMAPLEQLAAGIPTQRPGLPLLCDRTARLLEQAPAPGDWALHLREPVRFGEALAALAGVGCGLLLEVGPRATLLPAARAVLGPEVPAVAASRGRDELGAFAQALGALWAAGVPVRWEGLYTGRGARRCALPTTPMARQALRLEAHDAGVSAPQDPLVEVRWAPVAPREASAEGAWLLLGEDPLAEALAGELVARGGEVHRAAPGTPPRPGPWRAVVVVGEAPPPGLDPPARALRAAAGALRALRPWLDAEPAPLWFLTRGAVDLGGGAPAPEEAAVWGLARTLALECPPCWGGLLDLAGGVDAGRLAQALCAPPGRQLALRGAALSAASLRRVSEPSPPPPPRGGTWVITGGLGGLGRLLAEWLVGQGAEGLALLGRRADPHAAPPWVAAMRARGLQVQLEAVDVADAAALAQALDRVRAALPPLRGVIHAAGVLADAALFRTDEAALAGPLAPKLGGAWNLHHLTRQDPLHSFVLFSSAAGLLGSPGQGNYAAANAAMDGLAAWRIAQGLPALSLAWGPWAEVGMAAGGGASGGRARGPLQALDPARGVALLGRALGRVGVYGVLPCAPGAAPEGLWAHLDGGLPAAPVAAAVAEETGPIPAGEGEVEERVRSLAARVLGLDPAELGVEHNLSEQGLDSLLLMELIGQLRRVLGVQLYPREVLQAPTLRAITQRVLAQRAEPTPAGGAAGLQEFLGARPAQDPPTPVPGVVVVVTSARSGSTLLRVMLAGHPGLFCPPELYLLQYADAAERAARLQGTGLDEGLTRALLELGGGDAEAATAEAQALAERAAPCWEIYQRLHGALGGRLLVDKTPSYALSLDTLRRAERWFAGARYIHLVRHPLATMHSYTRNRMHRLVTDAELPGEVVAEAHWALSHEHAQTFRAEVDPARWLELRYEDLVQAPEATMRRVCAHLGLPFHDATLRPYEGARMTDGVRAGTLQIGDPGFAARRGIEAGLAEAWREAPPRVLPGGIRALAAELGYPLPAPTPPRSTSLRVQGLRTAVLQWGPDTPPAVVLVHGVLDHAGVWEDLAQQLAAQGVAARAPDLRGHGHSAHLGPEAGYRVLDALADLDALLRGWGGPPPLLVGHSMGAALAALYAAARPVAGLFLIEPGLGAAAPGGDTLRSWLDDRAAPPPAAVLPDEDTALQRASAAMGLPPRALRAFVQRGLEPCPGGLRWRVDPRWTRREGVLADSFALPPEGLRALLRQVRVPATLVWGADSGFSRPADRGAWAAALPQARVVELPGGHHLPLAQPTWLAALLTPSLGPRA